MTSATRQTEMFGVPPPNPGDPWRDDETAKLRIVLSEEEGESSTTIARRYCNEFPGRNWQAVRSAVVHERHRQGGY